MSLNNTPNLQEEEGNTTLGVACENGEAETARVLLNHSALTIDYQNKVCSYKHVVVVYLLISMVWSHYRKVSQRSI